MGAGRGRGFGRINAVLVGKEFGAVAGAELGKDGAVGPGEVGFGNGDFWSRSVEDGVGIKGGNGFLDGLVMEVLEDGSVGGGLDGAVGEKVGGNGGVAEGLKGLFLGTGEGRSGNYWMGGMVRSEGAGEELGAEEVEMVLDREVFGFGVEVAEGGHLVGSKAGTEGLVLDSLEFEDVGLGGIGKPDGSSVGKDGTEDSAVGEKHCFLLRTPEGARKGFEDVKTG